MKKQVAYLAVGYKDWPRIFPGGLRKVQGQIEAFKRAGFEVDLFAVDVENSFSAKIARRIPLGSDGYAWPSIDFSKYDCFYIRRPQFVSKEFLAFLRKAKSENERLMVLYEIPTFPYDKEDANLRKAPMLVRDIFNRRRLRDSVDYVVDLAGNDRIFGMQTIQMINGIDMTLLSSRKPSLFGNEINIICVATFGFWHGMDRLIEGLRLYKETYPEKKVVVHLVGDGPELEKLKSMVNRYELSDSIVFHGVCNEEQMDEIYDKCSLGVESLGSHRKGILVSSSLKSREYLAKGLPFIYAGAIDVFRKAPVDFCLQVPADESPIDIEEIVTFHNALYAGETEEGLIARIRRYAEDNVRVEMAMKNVIDHIAKGI